jgi:hypothetical protein
VEARSGGLAGRWGLNLKAPGAREGACGSILPPLPEARAAPAPVPGDGGEMEGLRETEQLVVVGNRRLFVVPVVLPFNSSQGR